MENLERIVTINKGIEIKIDSFFYNRDNKVIKNKHYVIDQFNKLYLQEENIKKYHFNDSVESVFINTYSQFEKKINHTEILYKYDNNYNMIEYLIIGKGGVNKINYKYGEDGLLTMKIDGFLDDTLYYQYNEEKLSEIILIENKIKRTVEKFWYDDAGNLVKYLILINGRELIYNYEYDRFNRLVKTKFPNNSLNLFSPNIVINYE